MAKHRAPVSSGAGRSNSLAWLHKHTDGAFEDVSQLVGGLDPLTPQPGPRLVGLLWKQTRLKMHLVQLMRRRPSRPRKRHDCSPRRLHNLHLRRERRSGVVVGGDWQGAANTAVGRRGWSSAPTAASCYGYNDETPPRQADGHRRRPAPPPPGMSRQQEVGRESLHIRGALIRDTVIY